MRPLRHADVYCSAVRYAFLSLIVFLVLTLATARAQNPIVIENQQAGSSGWDVDQDYVGSDAVGQIKGYASAVSVTKGQNITLYVSVNPPQTYTIDIYRIGWYGGAGGRLMQHIGPLSGVQQPACPVNATYGTIECHWAPAYVLATQSHWTSGIYIGTLTNAQGYKNYLTFVVRDDSRVAALIYQQPVATYQADNNWPNDGQTGKSTYDYMSYGATVPTTGYKSASKVSFDRPYYDSGIGEGFNGDTAEINFVRWLERSGYDVTYSTDVDTHAHGDRLVNYRGFLTAGHDEYWSKQMFDAVQAARDSGVHLGFFTGNSIYWQVRFEPSSEGVPNRVLVCYKDELLDPVSDPTLTTVLWRGAPVNRPEQTLMGVQYTVSIPAQNNQGFFPSFVVQNSSHWVYAGTGFTEGSSVRGLVGYETDRYFSSDPLPPTVPGTYTLLSHSAWGTGPDDHSNSVIYQSPSGAWVYTTGAMDWNWGLDDYGHGYNIVDARIQRTASNVLDRFVSGVATPSPTVTGLSPTSGPTTGGTTVTMSGTNFGAGATVKWGGTSATNVSVVNSTTMTARTPSHAAGAVDVMVINTDGRNGTLSGGFTYISTAPTVTGVSPASGPIAGGTAITMTGTNFNTGATVTVGGTAATGVTRVNSTTITATTPAHAAGVVSVTVTTPGGQSGTLPNGFTYTSSAPAPTVSSVAPTSGPATGGTTVTITGTNFVAGATVSLGGSAATNVSVVSSTTITATTPAHAAGVVSVTVTTPGGQSGTLPNGFTYTSSAPAPTVSSVAPTSGPATGGTTVTITGTNFVAGATVSLGGSAATNVSVVNSTTITATTPAHAAGAVSVTVTTPGGQSGTLPNGFTYTSSAPAPTVSSVAPTSGPATGGTTVTITGTNFVAGATVSLGGSAATNVSVVSSTTITATTPAHAAGAVSVTVTTPGGQSGTLPNGFTYTSPPPVISFVQVTAATPQSPTRTVPATYPGSQTAGDLNIVVVGWNDTTALVQSVEDTAGNVYSLAIGPTSGTGVRQSIYYAKNIRGGNNTVTVTFTQPAIYPDIRILEYKGVSTLDVTAGASGSGSTSSSGSATTTAANALIFSANTVSTDTRGPGSGFTSRIITSIDSDIAEDKIVTTTGTYSASAPLGKTGNWVMQMATFK